VISRVSALDASTLANTAPDYQRQWQDQAGALHTVVSANVLGTNLAGATVGVWLFNPSEPAGLFMGVFGLTSNANQIFLGLPGSTTQNILTPLASTGWWVQVALGQFFANNYSPPSGSVASATFYTLAPPASQTLVFEPLPSQVQMQAVINNDGLIVLLTGGQAQLTMGQNALGGYEGQLYLLGPGNSSLRLVPEFASTASPGGGTLPSNPTGFLAGYFNGTKVKFPFYNV
jgi:hypothetical protein